MTSVIFVEPESPGNIGAMARTMKNFNLHDLILVNPCEITTETKGRAMHAYDLVEKARIFDTFEQAIKNFDFLIGTSAVKTKNFKSERDSIDLEKFSKSMMKGKSAIIIGRESTGLTNEELSKCDLLLNINSNAKYPTLNATHAACVIFYKLYNSKKSSNDQVNITETLKTFSDVTEKINLKNKEKADEIFENLLKKSIISQEEANALVGVFKNIEKKL